MSFILDALRKSESRRRAADGTRLDGLPSINDPQAGRRRRGPFRPLLLTMVLLLPIVGLLAFWLTFERFGPPGESPPPAQAQQAPPEPGVAEDDDEPRQPFDPAGEDERSGSTEATVSAQPWAGDRDRPRERVISDPDEISRELDRMAASGELGLAAPDEESREEQRTPLPGAGRRAAPRPVEEVAQAEARRQQALAERRARERPQESLTRPTGITIEPRQESSPEESVARDDTPRRALARVEPLPEPEATPEPPSAAAEPADLSSGVAEYLHSWELPLSVRRNLPSMTLNIHVFSPEPERRFVLVNGERYVPGDVVADGVRLVDIRREGAILDFREHRFLLEP